MIHWDHAMRKARLSARLKVLAPVARTSFAAGSLFHAYGQVRVTPSWRQANEPLEQTLDRAFTAVWEGVGCGSAHTFGGPDLKADLERLAPGEDDTPLPGQADLVDGVLHLLSLRREPKPADASDMASYAYQAITEVALPTVRGGEEIFRHAEQSSPECLAEIAFQLAYLATLEEIGGGDVRWEHVFRPSAASPRGSA
jgi:hypothetical protein